MKHNFECATLRVSDADHDVMLMTSFPTRNMIQCAVVCGISTKFYSESKKLCVCKLCIDRIADSGSNIVKGM